MTQGTDQVASAASRAKGRELVEGLQELANTLRAGEPLGSRFTVRTSRITPPPEYRGGDVKRVRQLLAMSQAAFAAFLGVDPSTVRSWEQGLRPPSPLARRLLSEIEADPPHWRRRLAACLVGPEIHVTDVKAPAVPRRRRRPRTVGEAE